MERPGTGIFAKSEPASIYVGGELERPFAALRAAIERDEGIFLLTGESGSGKSALLARLADELRLTGHKVVLTTPHNNAHLIAWLSGVHLAAGTLPPGPRRSGRAALVGRADRQQMGLPRPGRVRSGVPAGVRHAAGRVPPPVRPAVLRRRDPATAVGACRAQHHAEGDGELRDDEEPLQDEIPIEPLERPEACIGAQRQHDENRDADPS